jgi:outer membrane protein assembly factor BamA
MALASVELRFPLFGVFSRRSYYGPLPVEGIVFGDTGVAWWSNDRPSFLGGSRDALRSVGTGIRFNALGFLIGEVDFVKPIDRPERGWMWQFNFVPGF